MKRKMKNKMTQYIDSQLFIFFLMLKKEKENNRLILDALDFPDEQDAKNQVNQNNPKNHGLDYQDIAGFCKSANIQDIRKNNYILTPGRYIEFKQVEEDQQAFDEKMQMLTASLSEQM